VAQVLSVVELLLVLFGMALLVLELKAPGSFAFAGLAACLFIVFFWVQAIGGAPLIGLAVALFLLGLALVGVELVLAPGSVVAGVIGLMLVLAGLVVASLDKTPETASDWSGVAVQALKCGLTMAAGTVLAWTAAKHLSYIPFANRLILSPPADHSDDPSEDPRETLLGQIGTAVSVVGFAGTARIRNRRVSVLTDGEFIPAGTPVRVIEVEGARVVVRRA
jgi:membrane-bound serine protease (ClpP class)